MHSGASWTGGTMAALRLALQELKSGLLDDWTVRRPSGMRVRFNFSRAIGLTVTTPTGTAIRPRQ